jgi:hypothetical protein
VVTDNSRERGENPELTVTRGWNGGNFISRAFGLGRSGTLPE